MRVQVELQAKGLFFGQLDGRMTPNLRDSLRAFQILNDLPETGSMDNATLAALGTLY